MSPHALAPTGGRRHRSILLAALAAVSATILGVVAGQSAEPSRADGVVSGRVTVFTDDHPAVVRLDPDLRRALRRAATAAARHEVEIVVRSGWRSPRYQAQLFHAAVSHYGSEERAARWVARADASRHVSGDAVDIGPAAGMAWMAKHGAAYGLCPIYRNEPWHYELRGTGEARGCPPVYASPAHDPRMRQ